MWRSGGGGLPVSWRHHVGLADLLAAATGFSGVGLSAIGPFRPSLHLLGARSLLPSKGWPFPSYGSSLVSRPVQQDRARLAHSAAGPSSSRARCSRTDLVPTPRCCRTDLVSRSGLQDGSMDASVGRPVESRCWGWARGAKADPFLLVSLVGVAAGLGCGGDKVLDAWAAALVAVHGALGQSPCLGAAR